MPSSRPLVPLVAGALAVSLVAVSATGAAAATGARSAPRATSAALPSVLPSWAATATVVGATPADQKVYVDFALAKKDVAGDEAYGTAATTPGNPLYRHWLSKDEYIARFGAVPGAADAVTTVLRGAGVSGAKVDAMGLSVLAPMTAAQASALFGVQFHELKHDGLTVRVPTSEPTLPASLVGKVVAVDGLTQHPVHTDHTAMVPVKVAEGPTPPASPNQAAPTAYFNAGPKSDYFGQKLATDKPTATKFLADAGTTKPYTVGGYTPAQLRGAYGVDQTSYTGKGVNVGVALFFTGADAGADLQTFSAKFGLPFVSGPGGTYTDVCPQSTDPVNDPVGLIGAAGEQALDIEAIHQMAPDASITYCGAEAPEDEPIYVALSTLIAAGTEVINNSYGGTGDTDATDAMAFKTQITDVAKSMGVGLDYSSGDAADNVTAHAKREVDFPASSDGVTAVGGTLLEVGSQNDYQGEAFWGTYSTDALATGATSWGTIKSQAGGAGGGGGVSTAFAEPTYQTGVVPPAETTNADTGTTRAGRVVPDVSMLGDSTTGILVGETQVPDVNPDGTVNTTAAASYSYYRIGGTSVSSPLFTGVMALVDEALSTKAGATTSAGFINPTIYPFLAQHPNAFRDPSLGLSAGERHGGTVAQTRASCSGTDNDVCVGTGPGVVPILSEVRADYTDTANDGIATTDTDPITGLVTVSSTPGNPVVYHLRGQGIIGTLDDLHGYDDSTGLGSPNAPYFIAAFLGSDAPVANLPDASAPVELVVVGGLLAVAAAAVVVRRRRAA